MRECSEMFSNREGHHDRGGGETGGESGPVAAVPREVAKSVAVVGEKDTTVIVTYTAPVGFFGCRRTTGELGPCRDSAVELRRLVRETLTDCGGRLCTTVALRLVKTAGEVTAQKTAADDDWLSDSLRQFGTRS